MTPIFVRTWWQLLLSGIFMFTYAYNSDTINIIIIFGGETMLDKMRFERISIMAAVMWEILALIAGALLIGATLFILAPFTWLWYTVLFIIGFAIICATFLYIPFLYVNTEFAINKQAIIYRKGVIFRSTQILYRERIVFVTVYANPLSPLLKISTLQISAAGGGMTILFLNSKRASELASLLAREKLGYGNEI